jgi:hypothetical protein
MDSNNREELQKKKKQPGFETPATQEQKQK